MKMGTGKILVGVLAMAVCLGGTARAAGESAAWQLGIGKDKGPEAGIVEEIKPSVAPAVTGANAASDAQLVLKELSVGDRVLTEDGNCYGGVIEIYPDGDVLVHLRSTLPNDNRDLGYKKFAAKSLARADEGNCSGGFCVKDYVIPPGGRPGLVVGRDQLGVTGIDGKIADGERGYVEGVYPDGDVAVRIIAGCKGYGGGYKKLPVSVLIKDTPRRIAQAESNPQTVVYPTSYYYAPPLHHSKSQGKKHPTWPYWHSH